MGNAITPTEFVKLFTYSYMKLNHDEYISQILDRVPREYDRWQDEKFATFHAAADELSRLSLEEVERIIEYAMQRRNE